MSEGMMAGATTADAAAGDAAPEAIWAPASNIGECQLNPISHISHRVLDIARPSIYTRYSDFSALFSPVKGNHCARGTTRATREASRA
jgi:hypothetical protein